MNINIFLPTIILSREADVVDTTPPVLSNFYIPDANKDRIYFDSSESITGSSVTGISVTTPTKTVTGVTINGTSTSGHYFTVNSEFVAGETPTIAGTGADNIADLAGNGLASFSEAPDNQIVFVEEALGVIFSESFASSIPAAFTNAGSSGITYSSGELNFTGGAGTFAKTLKFTDSGNPHHHTCLEVWKQTLKVRTPSTLTAGYGVGIGVDSTNNFETLSTLIRWAWDDSGRIYFYWDEDLGTQNNNAGFVPSTSTYYLLEVTRTYNSMNVKIKSEDGVTTHADVTRTWAVTYPQSSRYHNTGQFCLWNFGGTNVKVKEWEVSSTEQKYVDIVCVGDSNMHGLFAGATFSNRYIDLAIPTKSYTVLAGIADRTSDILDRIDEIIELCKPTTVIYLNIGSNDVGSGRSQANYESDYNDILTALASYTVVLGTSIARSDQNLTTLNSFISGKSGSYDIIDLFEETRNTGTYTLKAAYNTDNIHLNTAGHSACASIAGAVLEP